jgi:4-amino-4-deoxy-L-arabinose transferase-like glycosyltransferase
MTFTNKIREKTGAVWTLMKKNPWKTALLILFICLSLALKIHEIQRGAGDEFPGSDAWSYNNNAQKFLQEGQPISSYFNSLEPIYLVIVYGIFGYNILIARIIQILFSFAIPFFIYFVARKFFGWKAGYVAAILALIHPSIIYYSAHLWSELWIMFFFSASLYVFVRAMDREKQKLSDYVQIGVYSGIASLGKIWVLALGAILVFFLLLWTCRKSFQNFVKNSLIYGGIFLAALIVVLLPWCIYASHNAGYFIFINSNSPTNLYIGNNPEGEIAYTSKVYNWDYLNAVELKEGNCGILLKDTLGVGQENIHDMYLKKCAGKYAVGYILGHPGKFIVKMTKFTFEFWLFPNLEFYQRYVTSPETLKFALWFFWIFGAIGLIASFQRFKEFLPFYFMILTAWFINGMAFYLARYKAGLSPITVFFAAGGIYAVWYLLFGSMRKKEHQEPEEQRKKNRKRH